MHVEGERRGGIALRKLLRHGAVGFVVGPEPAVALGHAQAEEPLGAEIGIVVKGKGCGAVVAVRARGEALAARRRARAINSPCREAGWRCIKGLTYAGHLSLR